MTIKCVLNFKSCDIYVYVYNLKNYNENLKINVLKLM